MDPLRIVLLLGMVAHKALWEVLKRGEQPAAPRPRRLLPTLVKSAKVVFLLFLVVQTLFLNLFPISDRPSTLQAAGLAIYVVGLATAMIGRLQLGQNWANLEDYQVLHGQALVTGGLYRYIRHPIYVGDVLLVVGLELALNSWLVLGTVLVAVVVVRQALAEEAGLARAFPGYEQYRARTKRFIPFVV